MVCVSLSAHREIINTPENPKQTLCIIKLGASIKQCIMLLKYYGEQYSMIELKYIQNYPQSKLL